MSKDANLWPIKRRIVLKVLEKMCPVDSIQAKDYYLIICQIWIIVNAVDKGLQKVSLGYYLDIARLGCAPMVQASIIYAPVEVQQLFSQLTRPAVKDSHSY